MSFLYPLRVAIYRPAAQTGTGYQADYAAVQTAEETLVADNLPASLQVRREGQRSPTSLPADGNQTVWWIFISRRALAYGQVLDRDVVVDPLGQRYQVVANYWTVLGYRLTCYRLES